MFNMYIKCDKYMDNMMKKCEKKSFLCIESAVFKGLTVTQRCL